MVRASYTGGWAVQKVTEVARQAWSDKVRHRQHPHNTSRTVRVAAVALVVAAAIAVSMTGSAAAQADYEVDIDETNSPVEQGETLEVMAEITNVGDVAGEQDVVLEIDGDAVDGVEEVVLEAGMSTTETLVWNTEDEEGGDYNATVSSDDDSDSEMVAVEEPAFFEVDIEETNSPVEEGDLLEVTAEISNTGDETDGQDIDLEIDGEVEDTELEVVLEAGMSTTETLEYQTEEGDAPEVDATVASEDDSDLELVVVEEPAFFEVEITETNSPVQEGETLEVAADVTNTGDVEDTKYVTFEIWAEDWDDEIDSQPLTLEGGETDEVVFQWGTEEGDASDDLEALVETEDSGDWELVEVEEAEDTFFDVDIIQTNSPVEEGDTLSVTAEVSNDGDLEDTQEIELGVMAEDDDIPTQVDSSTLTLDGGEATDIDLVWGTDDGDAGDYDAIVESDQDTDMEEVTVEEGELEDEDEEGDEPTSFAVDIVDTNSPVVEGELAEVTVEVTNTGDLEGTQDVEVSVEDDDGAVVMEDVVTVSLDGGQSASIFFELPTEDGDAGEYDVIVESEDESASTSLVVEAEEHASFDVLIDGTNSPVEAGEGLVVNAEVTNTGDVEESDEVRLEIDGETMDTSETEIDDGETESLALEWATTVGQSGSFLAVVRSSADNDSTDVTVEEVDIEESEPEAGFLVDPELPTVEDTVELVSDPSNPDDVEIAEYQWTLTDIDGEQEELAGQRVEPELLGEEGTYNVVHTIEDEFGRTDQVERDVRVRGPPDRVELSPVDERSAGFEEETEAEETLVAEIPDLDVDEELGHRVSEVRASLTETQTVALNVTRDDEPMRGAPDPSQWDSFGYIDLEHDISDDAVEEAPFTFEVDEEEIAGHDAEADELVLQRYDEDNEFWETYEARMVRERPDSFVYQAVAPGMSVFSVSAPSSAEERGGGGGGGMADLIRSSPELELTGLSVDLEEATVGDSAEVTGTAEVDGDKSIELEFEVDDNIVEVDKFFLRSDQTRDFSFSYEFASTGDYELTVNDEAAGVVSVSQVEYDDEEDEEDVAEDEAEDGADDDVDEADAEGEEDEADVADDADEEIQEEDTATTEETGEQEDADEEDVDEEPEDEGLPGFTFLAGLAALTVAALQRLNRSPADV